MRMIVVFCFAFLLQIGTTKAQDSIFAIAGPDYYEFCSPWCQQFTINLDSLYFWEEIVMFIDPTPGTSITQSIDNVFEVCIDIPGYYTLIAQGFGFGPNQNTVFASDTVYILIFEDDPVTGEIYTTTCVDSSDRGDCLKVCEFTEATYHVTSSGINGSWYVQGAVSYQDNGGSVDVTWGAAGMGYIEFLPFSMCNNFPITACVDILPTPEADFTSLPLAENGIIQLCKGQPLYLENLSLNAARYEWTFGDGTNSELADPEHIYLTPGIYTLTLKAFNLCDCDATKSIQVEVLPAPAPELSCVATVCPDDKIRYVASTDGCQTFYWTVSSNGTVLSGGGISDDFIEVEWGPGPDGIIELLVENCNQAYCSKPAIFRIPIVSTDGPISGDAHVCSGEVVTYKAPYFPGVSYQWSTSSLGTIVSGQNTNAVSVRWAMVSSPQLNESVNVSYGHCYLGCDGSDQFDVRIVPNVSITGDNQFCEKQDAIFSSGAGFGVQTPIISSWALYNSSGDELWTSGPDDEIVINLNFAPGDFTIIATPSNPNDVCQNQIEKDFIITALPELPLGILGDSFICPGIEYAFEIQNANNYNTIWAIIDGAITHTYEGQIITHVFGNTPPYIVQAAHGDLIYPACQSDFISKTILPAGDAEIIGLDENCMEEYTVYKVYDLPGNILEWRVDPPDMAEISNKNSKQASFYWVKNGNAQIILNACGQDIIKNVLIHSLPQPAVNYPAGLCKNDVAHVSTTFDYESQIWRDSSGSIISTDSTTTLYPGYYSVEVTDINGCIGKTTFEIEFYPTPTARISTLGNTGHCMSVDPIELVANTDGIDYSFQWLHEGTAVGSNSPRLMASDFGYYQVEITNKYGCSVLSNVITLFDWCGGSSGTCNGQTCNNYPCVIYGTLGFNHSDIDCNTKRYMEDTPVPVISGSVRWDIEQSNGSYKRILGDDVQHTYTDAGYYTVVLTAKIDGFPYADTSCYHLVAFKDTVELASRFEYHGACAQSAISFEDLSTFLPDYGISNWSWDFGDGNFSSAQHPTNIYSSAGTYTVTLVTTSTSGCTSTIQNEVEVFAPPVLNMISQIEACEDNPVEFHINSPQNLFNISWDFDDPGSLNNAGTVESVFHAFEDPGMYFPNVTADNIFSCSATTSMPINIVPNTLTGDISSSNGTVICEGESTNLLAPSGGVEWEWNTTEITSSITTGEAGHYNVLVTDDHGCQFSPNPIFIQVNPKPVATINGREVFGPNDAGHWIDTVETCEGVDLELQAFANTDVGYLWNTSEITQKISFTGEAGNLLSAGQHTFTVVVTDRLTNCSSEPAEIIIIVHDNPQDFTLAIQSGTACSESTNILEVLNPESGVHYVWSDGQEGEQIEATESGFYSVIATNAFGCTTESLNTLIINQSPRVDLFPSGCFIRCNPDTICIPTLDDVSYYEILLNNTVVESGNIPPTEFIASQSGSYTIYLQGNNGCDAVSEPLNLELYPGFGHIDLVVFVDVNDNGIIDGADTTISDIGVILLENTVEYNTLITNSDGSVYFLNVPQAIYTATIDTTSLPSDLVVIISDLMIEVVGCDLDFADSLLLGPLCEPERNDYQIDLCIGDSVFIEGNYYSQPQVLEFTIPGGPCDSIRAYTITEVEEMEVASYFIDACEGQNNGQIELVASSPNGIVDVQWNHSTSTALVLNDLGTGTYQYTLTDGKCTLNGDVLLGEYIFPAFEIESTDPLCPGSQDGEIVVSLASPELTWSLDSVLFTTGSFNQLPAGDHIIYFTNGHCVESEIITLEEKLINPFEIASEINVTVNSTIQITHNYIDSIVHDFLWSPADYLDCFDCPSPLFGGSSEDVLLAVLVTDPDGCDQQGYILVRADQSQHIFIPTAFSPNDDAINDYFKPFVREGIVFTDQLQIFDRWGNLIYEEEILPNETDIIGWDGKSKGKLNVPGLFIYNATFSYTNGETKQVAGEVHLIR